MTGDLLYDRYRDALKRGHVAALQGQLEEALTAYADAAAIAPERSTPHTSAGTALLRGGRPAEALRHFELATRLGPGDEAARLGHAEALAALDRRLDAADAFDAVAEARESGDDLVGAVDAASRALELAEGRERRRRLERLTTRLEAAGPDEASVRALEQARRVLEGVVLVLSPDLAAPGGLGVGLEEVGAAADTAADALLEEALADGGSIPPGPLDRPLPDLPLADLVRAADEAIETGEVALAIDRLLDVAAASRADGRAHAAVDACYRGLSLAPDDVNLHLALLELYAERGWAALAAEKAELLARLVALDGDPEAVRRVAAARARRD